MGKRSGGVGVGVQGQVVLMRNDDVDVDVDVVKIKQNVMFDCVCFHLLLLFLCDLTLQSILWKWYCRVPAEQH
jgi:hypothetical protein